MGFTSAHDVCRLWTLPQAINFSCLSLQDSKQLRHASNTTLFHIETRARQQRTLGALRMEWKRTACTMGTVP